ncbi:triacylglycerol lipase [Vibrio cholerae]|nr:triacylglycerol lipase [Vibrio cholerae]ELN8999422.1 triacylglycerol lipase [Vibrio cholerae]
MKIVILHGLYMHGLVMQPLAQRLNKLGYQTEVISYNTLAIDDEKVFQAIDCALAQNRINVLVGHSLGGLMIKHYLRSRHPSPNVISHVVALASPLKGASIVAKIQQLGLGAMLGNAHLYGLQLHQDSWELPQRLGCIAGTLRFGFRPILLGGSGMCDGTVTVAETQISGMTDHLILHQSHTGLVYSHQTAQQIDYFIRHNQFQHKKIPE